ncbi:AAA family ATPase [Gordonia sp. VNK1]|uniref:AAA family ATPase n=1 Tax=Gordonia oleivorans TaxID=3156618 RepID=UPI0032B3800C
MILKTVYVRFFRSFNFDYLRQDIDGKRYPWEALNTEPDAYYPFVRVGLEHDITTVVGANESGKSQLISAIQCLLGDKPVVPRDFCRYSRFFGVRGTMPTPEFGGRFTDLTPDEQTAVSEAASLHAAPTEFYFFRLQRGSFVYVKDGAGEYQEHIVQPNAENSQKLEDALRLPVARRVDANVVLPSSASLFDLQSGAVTPDVRDRSAWLELFKVLKGYADAPEGATESISTFVPKPPELPVSDRERARKALQLVRDLLENVADIDTQAYSELLGADAADDGYASALTASVTDALDVTLNFPKWWSQDKDFSLRVHKDAFHLVFTLTDKTGQTYTFDERSGGMQYFLSYFIQREAYRPLKPGRSEILLIDEPDAYLSTQGQQDLVKVFARYAEPDDGKPAAQILYVTHSPFLIDKNYPHRIRVLQKGAGDEGTRIVEKAATDKYEPLRSAFSSFHADTAFIGTCNLLVEGPADLILFSGISAAMQRLTKGNATLDLNSLTMVPVHGASNYRYMVHLARGRDLDRPAIVVLLDSDGAGREAGTALGNLEKGYGKKPLFNQSLILPIDRLPKAELALDVDEVHEPEDLVPAAVARVALVRFSEEILSDIDRQALLAKLPEALVVNASERLFDQAKSAFEAAADESNVAATLGKIEFAHAVSAVAREAHDDSALKELFQNFHCLFGQLNKLQDQAMAEHAQEQVKEVTKRIVDRFKRDHRARAQKATVSKLLDEIEVQLTGSTPGHEAVRTAARQIRDEFNLADTPLQDVEDFPALRDRLKELVVAPERVQS